MASSARDLTLRFLADTSQLRKQTTSIRKTISESWKKAGAEGKSSGAQFATAVGDGAKGAFDKTMGAAWGVAKTTAKVGGAAVAAVGAAAIAKGFGRLTAIEDATASLKGLGYSAKEAAQIINGPVNAAVKGTAFGLDEAAKAAQGALGAGVKNGKELEGYLKLVGDAASQSGTDFQSMALMLNKVHGAGKLSGDVLQQMAENGLQVMPMLTKALGKPQAEVQKMVSEGKISAKQFEQILTQNIGGAAQKAGNTTSGAFKNMGAALGRVGAKFLNSVFPMFKTVISGITKLFDGIGPIAEDMGKKFGNFLNPLMKAFSKFTAQLGSGKISKAFTPFIDLGKQLGTLLGNLAKIILPMLAGAFKGLVGALSAVAKVLTPIIGYFNQHQGALKALVYTVTALAAAFVTLGAVLKAYALAQKIVAGVTKAVAVAQAVLNAVMSANPIMLVVIAIGLLVAAFVIAYKKSETFRKIVNAAFDGIKNGAKAFAKFFTTTIPNAFKKVIGWIKANWKKAVFLNPVTAAVALLVKNRDKIIAIFTKLTGWIKGAFKKSWSAVKTVLLAPMNGAQKAIAAVWSKIKKGFSTARTWTATTWKKGWSKVSGWMSDAVGKGRDKISSLWKSTRDKFSNAKTWVSGNWKKSWSNVSTWMSNAVGKGRDKIGSAWKSARSKFTAAKTWVSGTWRKSWNRAEEWIKHPIQSAKDAIAKILGNKGLQKVMRGAVSAIGKIWSGLKAAIGKPLNKVIDFINTGFIRGGINKILKALGVPQKSLIPWISPVSFAAGGPVTGGSPWQRSGRDRYPAYLDQDEHVLTREEVRKLGGHRKVFQWRKAIQQGKAYDYPALASGGVVKPVPGGFGAFPSYPGHTGVDFPVGMGTPVHAVMAGIIKTVRALTVSYGRHIIQSLPIPGNYEGLYAHLRSFAVGVGQRVNAGQVIGYSDSTGNSTGPHLHFTLQHPGGNYVDPTSFLNSGKAPGQTSGGGIGQTITDWFSDKLSFLKGLDPVKWLTNKASSAKERILGFLGTNSWAQGLAMVPGLIMKKAGSYISDKVGGMFGGGGDASISGSAQEIGHKLMLAAGFSENQWSALKQLWEHESNWNPKAMNASSGATGIPQALPGNKMASAGSDWRTNPATQIKWGLGYIKSVYGTPSNAWAKWQARSPHWYDQGGMLKPGLNLAYNGTSRPEPVLSGEQWQALTADPRPHTLEVHFHGVIDSATAAREIKTLLRNEERVTGGVTLPSRSRKVVRST